VLILVSAIVIPVASGFAPGASFGERVLFGVTEGIVLAVITGLCLKAMQRRRTRSLNEFAARSRDAEAAARQDVAIYLHSAVQPKLLAISREIASFKTSETTAIAERLDAVSEEFIREVSHSLYPPELLVSLEFGLETLLAGRAELILDKRLTANSPVGLFDLNLASEDKKYDQSELRLEVDSNLRWAIYSVVRELVANAEKKPDVRKITVSVLLVDDSIDVKVSDDGHSLPKKMTRGLGHSTVEKIAADFGGSFRIKNLPLGVEAQCVFPYEPKTSLEAVKRRRSKIDKKHGASVV
jgi:signal transduction histidine kinase